MGMKAPVTTTPIDFAAVAKAADLVALISGDLGHPASTRGGPKWCCPFHQDSNPSLYLFDGGKRWSCQPCGKHGDAIDWLVAREGINPAEAARRLDGSLRPKQARKARKPDPPPKPAPKPPERRQSDDWQEAVDSIVRDAERALWGEEGAQALAWLRARGLDDHTISRFRLGYLPRDVRRPDVQVHGKPFWARRGITIPWVAPESWYSPLDQPDGPRWVGCNVRLLDGTGPKYQAITGSQRGYAYPLPDLTPGVPVLVAEGELDALIGWQEMGWIASVVTTGGATQTPRAEALEALAACPDWLLLFDHDQAGDKGASTWRSMARGRDRRLWLPAPHNDLTDLHRAGGSILEWLRGEFTRFGWPWPGRVAG